jgi:hypothetical protein
MHKLGQAPYIGKQIIELIVASLATNIVSRTNYMCIISQNDPTLFMDMLYKAFMLFTTRYYSYSSICPHP